MLQCELTTAEGRIDKRIGHGQMQAAIGSSFTAQREAMGVEVVVYGQSGGIFPPHEILRISAVFGKEKMVVMSIESAEAYAPLWTEIEQLPASSEIVHIAPSRQFARSTMIAIVEE